jgi:hypothetical protein
MELVRGASSTEHSVGVRFVEVQKASPRDVHSDYITAPCEFARGFGSLSVHLHLPARRPFRRDTARL